MSKRHPGRFSRPSTSGGGSAGPFLSKPAWARSKAGICGTDFDCRNSVTDRAHLSLPERVAASSPPSTGGEVASRSDDGEGLSGKYELPLTLALPVKNRERETPTLLPIASVRGLAPTPPPPLPVLSPELVEGSKDYGERVRVRGSTSLQTGFIE